jgi:hypothetical protein
VRRGTLGVAQPVVSAGENDEASDAWEESEDFALGSISASMVGAAGFEPATSRV